MRFLSLTAALVLAIISSKTARAGVIYEIGFDSAVYNVNPGDSLDVQVLLRETVTDGDIARLAVGNFDGAISFGALVDYSTVAGGVSGATVGGAGDVTLNETDFDDVFFNDVSVDTVSKTISMAGFSTSLDGIEVAATALGSGVYELELATINLTASGVAGEQTTLSLLDLDVLFDDTVFNDFFAADADLIFGSATISNLSAVPEPGSCVVLALCGVALGFRRRQRQPLGSGVGHTEFRHLVANTSGG